MGFSVIHIALILLAAWLSLKYFNREEEVFNSDVMVKHKNVLVTGASSGIGRATALRFCKLGANVYVTARSEEKLKDVVVNCKEVGATGAIHGYVKGDMGDLDQAEKVVHESAEALGGLDFLVLNHADVGLRHMFTMYQYTPEDFKLLKRLFDVNFFSYVTMASAAMTYLRKSGGKVATISSISGRQPYILVSKYAATKHALEGFFRSIDLENHFLETNVSFTVFNLGVIDTKKSGDAIMEDYAYLMKQMSVYGIDIMKLFAGYNVPADMDKCADEIIRATALREPESYFPKDYSLWWLVLKPHLFPYSQRSYMNEIKVKN